MLEYWEIAKSLNLAQGANCRPGPLLPLPSLLPCSLCHGDRGARRRRTRSPPQPLQRHLARIRTPARPRTLALPQISLARLPLSFFPSARTEVAAVAIVDRVLATVPPPPSCDYHSLRGGLLLQPARGIGRCSTTSPPPRLFPIRQPTSSPGNSAVAGPSPSTPSPPLCSW